MYEIPFPVHENLLSDTIDNIKGSFDNVFDVQEVNDTTRIDVEDETGSSFNVLLRFDNSHLQFYNPQKSSKFVLINYTT